MLKRTRAHLAYRAKLAVFQLCAVQAALDERDCRTLESHMGFRGQWEEHRRFQIEFAKRQGLHPASRFIEIGCGPLTLGLPAIAFLDPGRYIGIDVRPAVLKLAWQQVGNAGLADKNARLVCSQSFGEQELPAEVQADMMWSFSVLYHLTDELVDRCFSQVARRLVPGGRYIANINAQQRESTWLEFPFNKRDVGFYRDIAQRHGLVLTELGTLQSNGFRLDAMEKVNILIALQRQPQPASSGN